jgi:DUF218 domain
MKVMTLIVAGHSAKALHGDPMTEEGLILLPYQKDGSHYLLFQKQVAHAVKLARESLSSGWRVALVFSGGVSRDETPISEAATYHEIATRLPEWDSSLDDSVVLEEKSRDSYENLLFGCAAAFETVQSVPDLVAVVSFKFKERRFNFHAASIGLVPEWLQVPADAMNELPAFRFEGVGNPPDFLRAEAGEEQAMRLFTVDPHGVSSLCRGKRNARNPTGARQTYFESVGEWPLLRALLELNALAG